MGANVLKADFKRRGLAGRDGYFFGSYGIESLLLNQDFVSARQKLKARVFYSRHFTGRNHNVITLDSDFCAGGNAVLVYYAELKVSILCRLRLLPEREGKHLFRAARKITAERHKEKNTKLGQQRLHDFAAWCHGLNRLKHG